MSKCRIAVLVSGNGTNLQALIDAIHKNEINGEIIIVISSNKNAYALTRAKNHNINSVYINKENNSTQENRDEFILEILKKNNINLIILAGFLKILGKELITTFSERIINIHPAIDKKYSGSGFYGMKIHKAVLLNHEKVSGVTIHFVDEGIDTGRIILKERVKIYNFDTEISLQKKIQKIEHKLIIQAVKFFC